MTTSSIIIDIFVVVIITFSIIAGYIKGFTAVVLKLAAWLLALSLSIVLAGPITEYCYNYIDRSMVEKIDSSFTDAIKVDDSMEENIDKAMNELPKSLKNAVNYLGYTNEYIDRCINDKYGSQDEIKVGRTISDIICPAVVGILKLPIFLVLFFLLLAVFQWIAKLIDKAFRFSVIGVINRILGGVVGLIKGILATLIIGLLIYAFIGFTGDSNGFINSKVISETHVFGNIYSNNPFVNILISDNDK